ncbi:hypothetical protein NL676_001349 [Syzygium grande]|nr:hypothetical protein NL676_001349 [Syzygium grande]
MRTSKYYTWLVQPQGGELEECRGIYAGASRWNDLLLVRFIQSPPSPLPKVIKNFTFTVDDNFLNTRPGSPPDFPPSPEASPRACIGCIGVISRFDVLQLGDGSRDGVAVEDMQDENPGGRNGSAGIVNRIAGMKLKVVLKVSMNGHASRFYWFGHQNPHSKALKLATGFAGVRSVAPMGDQDRIVVTGAGDRLELIYLLRKKVGLAYLVSVSKDKNEGESKDNTGEM